MGEVFPDAVDTQGIVKEARKGIISDNGLQLIVNRLSSL
jgi:hypothetical protein